MEENKVEYVERVPEKKWEGKCCKRGGGGVAGCGGIYGLAFIGAFIYYVQNATTFTMGVIGFLKALVWPAFLIYRLFEFLHM